VVSILLLVAPRSAIEWLRGTILEPYRRNVKDTPATWWTFRLIGALFGAGFLLAIAALIRLMITGCLGWPTC